MFDNIGRKIKGLATFVCWIGIITSAILGIVFINLGTKSYNYVFVILGIAILVVGGLSSWIGAFLAYGFGELVDNSTIQNIKVAAPVPTRTYEEVKTPIIHENHPVESSDWKCIRCNHINKVSNLFCTECGEKRPLDWKCTNCKITHPADEMFCSQCGLSQKEAATIQQQRMEDMDNIDFEDILDKANSAKNAMEIYNILDHAVKNKEDDNISRLLKMIREATQIERNYGSQKVIVIKQIKAFSKYGKVFVIDTSKEKDACPQCGCVQNTTRLCCTECGALFDKK